MPEIRSPARQSLWTFLLAGQEEWKKDGGVPLLERAQEPLMAWDHIWPLILRALRRRPMRVATLDYDATKLVGLFWKIEDFKELKDIDEELYQMLVDTDIEERKGMAYFQEHCTYFGEQVKEEGCRALGIAEHVIREWVDGVSFDFKAGQPLHFSKTPYLNIY
eukprot:58870-Rhodomonas_salina.1